MASTFWCWIKTLLQTNYQHEKVPTRQAIQLGSSSHHDRLAQDVQNGEANIRLMGRFYEQHCRETKWEYKLRIHSLKKRKIIFIGLSPNFKFCQVDMVHIQCFEFHCDPNSKWYSFKLHRLGVPFEVVCVFLQGRSKTNQSVRGTSQHSTSTFQFGLNLFETLCMTNIATKSRQPCILTHLRQRSLSQGLPSRIW